MKNGEKNYSEKLAEVFANLVNIQKDFVSGRTGLKAIINFIDEMSRKKTVSFALDDPILVKGNEIMGEVIKKLETQYDTLHKLTPPADLSKTHDNFMKSLKLQIAGYKEMVEMFYDYKVTHVLKGREKVNKGLVLIK